MAFSKSFAREVPGSTMPKWEEIFLTAQEEREAEQVARRENMYVMRQCIADAKSIIRAEKMMDMQSTILSVAISLYKKRASHEIFYKEEKCKKKFQQYYGVLSKLKEERTKKTRKTAEPEKDDKQKRKKTKTERKKKRR